MTKRETTERPENEGEWGYRAHRIAQLRANLKLTHAQRLEWLERTNVQMRELLGLARAGSTEAGEERPEKS